jgi:hypothetical protein
LCFDKEKYLQIKVVGKTCQYTNWSVCVCINPYLKI